MTMSKTIKVEVAPRFDNFVTDWKYSTQLVLGGYGSGKSYHVALKIILKCFEEKRKVLVLREVYETHKESTFDLFSEILDRMGILEEDNVRKSEINVVRTLSPLQFKFPNGSRIIFRGMDKPKKLKSINDVSIVWLEEASEIKYEGYKEIKGRLRHRELKMYFILSTNPVGKENWIYTHFFKRQDDNGKEIVIMDDEILYKAKTLVKRNVLYHHSTADDNPFLPKQYIETLNELYEYDKVLYRIARLGKFGASGVRVLPNFHIATDAAKFKKAIKEIPENMHFRGFDFGFEESYNAIVWCAVDDKNKILYIYREYYKNKMTDDKTADELLLDYPELPKQQIVADCEDPKAIQYYRQRGFTIRGCKKYKGSRLANTKKMKRFKKIICSPACVNTIRELKDLVYFKDANGVTKYDEFNIDPHTFSALWYALDTYNVADIKTEVRNSRKGIAA